MQGNDEHPTTSSSPWRQPVVWLVVALVATAVAGGIAMVVIASGDGAVDAVPDPVRRTAQVQVVDLGPDVRARSESLSAIVRIDAKGGSMADTVVGWVQNGKISQVRLSELAK